ncbi:MAG: D-xylose transport system permease protein [Frankiaceae bacterium]|jgi:D-xylose transport system permease protein|nr:D-xylose transport system permease protein [Frankiaceae bacterium]
MTSDDSDSTGATREPGTPAAATALQPDTSTKSTAATDFANDAGVTTLSQAFRNYVDNVRGGQVGALPAILGLILLTAIFGTTVHNFLTAGNLANLCVQGAATALIAMGLVFVLLLGEIDLSAGTAAGVSAALMAVTINNHGHAQQALGRGAYYAVVLFMIAAVYIAYRARLWYAVGMSALGLIVLVGGLAGSAPIALFLCVATGTSIGLVTGWLISRIGIPSFVVTLALFLAWQGVILQFIGEGASLPTRNFTLIDAIANRVVPPLYGWIMVVVSLTLYGIVTIGRSVRRRRDNLAAEPMVVVVGRLAVLTAIGVGMLVLLNAERAPTPEIRSIKGIPYVIPIIIVLLVFWTMVLGKTAYGRHVYAVGGNAEGARRAGIDVPRIRLSVFVICSSMAAMGGIVLTSFVGGVQNDLGAGNTLLFSVGAAVIGGTSLFGGRGRVRDAILGGFVIAMIPNGLQLIPNIKSSFVYIITAFVLLLAASVDALSRRRAGARGNL